MRVDDPDRYGTERGIFRLGAQDDRRKRRLWAGEWWKNTDFLRLKDFALHLVDPRPGTRVLDIGCADGPQMVYCGLQGADVYGQDLNVDSVAAANRKLKELNINGHAVVGDTERLLFDDSWVDVVLSSDFHEHLSGRRQLEVLREARRVLRPGGRLVLKTPNLTYLRAALAVKRLRRVARGQDSRGLVIAHTSQPDPEHIGLTTRWKLASQLREAGFLNFGFHYAPLRRVKAAAIEVLSTEVPIMRDVLCEDIFCTAYKPIALSHFPD